METSPDAVKAVGRFDVTAVSEIENREDPPEVMLNRLPVMSPAAPIFSLKRSPEAVAGVAGDQSNESKRPEVRAVEVEDRLSRFPVVRAEADMPKTSPVVVTVLFISAITPAAVSIPYAAEVAEA